MATWLRTLPADRIACAVPNAAMGRGAMLGGPMRSGSVRCDATRCGVSTANERGRPATVAVDHEIARLASRQRGVAHRDQLIAVGLGAAAITSRVASGRLYRVLPSVYAVGHVALPEGGREMAVQLWRAPHGVLSHDTAAWIWGFSGAAEVVHVSGPAGGTMSQPGTVVHRVRRLDASDIRSRDGFRVTSPARTILDLAASWSARDLERAVAEARVIGLVRERHLREVIERYPQRSGSRGLAALLDAEHGPAFTRSDMERDLLALVRKAGVAPPRTNAPLGGYEVDALWADERLVVELDSFRFHRSRRAFERDRRKSAELQTAGYRVLQVTWRQLRDSPEVVVAQIAAALALGRA